MPKILIIEDSQRNRDLLARCLRRHGFDVVEAENGVEGIERARTEAPHLILMDLNMPELDGWEATQLIRSDQQIQAIPIIALTGHAVPGDRERALAVGCNDYHTKPLQVEQLLEQIETLLQQPDRHRG